MLVKQELIKRIKEYFDLNIYETKVWLGLLSKGIASAGEVAEISGVPRSRTYDVLESLEKRGFAIVKIGKPIKYIAVKPTEVIEKMKSKTWQEATDKIKSLVNLKETQEYMEIEQLHKTGISPIKSHEITGSLKGRSNILSRTRELLENAEKEVLICTSVDDFEDKSRVLVPTLDRLIKKNVKIKIALSGDEESIKKLNNRLPVKAKKLDTRARLYSSDRSQVLFMITPENSDDDVAIWLHSPFFTESIYSMFDNSLRKS